MASVNWDKRTAQKKHTIKEKEPTTINLTPIDTENITLTIRYIPHSHQQTYHNTSNNPKITPSNHSYREEGYKYTQQKEQDYI